MFILFMKMFPIIMNSSPSLLCGFIRFASCLTLAVLAPHSLIVAQSASEEAPSPSFYAKQIDLLKTESSRDAALKAKVDTIIANARVVAEEPVVERALSLEELKNPGTRRLGSIDTRTWNVHPVDAKKAEIFALSMADTTSAGILANEMPLLAAAYRLTGEKVFLDRLTKQIEELSTWNPLQRHGWTLFEAKNSMPPDGDGVWLATGQGLMALTQALALLPPDSLSPETQQKIRVFLDREIRRIVKDWKDERPWYVRKQAVTSNQWVVPISGLVVACVAAGRENYPDAYALGVDSLLKTLEALGNEGAVSEGTGYATYWTTPYLCMSAISTADVGDDRLSKSTFLKNFPLWIVQSFQPGENIINSFDTFGATRGKYHSVTADLVRLSALTRDPYLAWLIKEKFPYIRPDFYSLLLLSFPPAETKEPPLWGLYERAHWVVWRSSWAEDASGVWVRGGHPLDGHDHLDRGHVNFIVHGKPLLIEAGTPGYNEVLKREKYDSVVGHNVLQVGEDISPKKAPAPITVQSLTQEGGEVTVEAGGGYPQVAQWQRRVSWTAGKMTITDTLRLKQPEMVKFRWHLGSEEPLKTETTDERSVKLTLPPGRVEFPGWIGNLPETSTWTPPEKDVIETPSAGISLSADQSIKVSQEKNFDHVLKFRMWKHEHTTLVVQSAVPVETLTLVTEFISPSETPTPLVSASESVTP